MQREQNLLRRALIDVRKHIERKQDMKIRADFVSNSSSCSFIINDVQAGLKALKEFDILGASDISSIGARFTLSEEAFNALSMPELECWRDEREHEVFCSCDPSELLQLPKQALKSLKDLEFQCDDCEQEAVFMLALLYEAFRIKGVDVDNGCSEMDFPSTDDSDCVAAKLLKYISSNRKGKSR